MTKGLKVEAIRWKPEIDGGRGEVGIRPNIGLPVNTMYE